MQDDDQSDPKSELPKKKETKAEPNLLELHAYGSSALTNQLVGNIVNTISMPILNMSLKINPAWISTVLAIRAGVDAWSDPIMGYLSDNFTGSKWGRRRLFILIGGLLTGILSVLTWWLPKGLSDQHLIIYFGAGVVATAIAQTIFSVPYGALGIELSPSYHGRTRVFAFRAFWEKIANLISPWIYPFCLWGIFGDVVVGLRVFMIIVVSFTMSAAIVTALKARERTGQKKSAIADAISESEGNRLLAAGKVVCGIFVSIWKTLKNPHFLKIAAIYAILLFCFGLLGILGQYLNNYWVFQGDLKKGPIFYATYSNFAFVMSMLAIPFVSSLSKRIQKHNALAISLVLMMIGSILHQFCMIPGKPYFLYILPVFYSFGVSAIFTILPSLFADTVDMDELKTGERREGMFGAANSFIMKNAQSAATAMSGILIVATGFKSELGGNQPEGTLENMLVVYSWGQAAIILVALALLFRYPLTEKRMAEVREELEKRRGVVAEAD